MPYGPHYPVDTGLYFFPSSVALLVCSFVVLITGWNTPPTYRIWLFLPAVMLLATLIFTVLWFWPTNAALWEVAKGAWNPGDREQVIRMAHQWVAYDWLRIAMGTVGFVSAVRAISIPFPASQDFPTAQRTR